MKPEEKETEKQSVRQANWKVRADTLRRINQQCLDRDVTQADLAQLALDALDEQSPVGHQTGPRLITRRPGDPKRRRLHALVDLVADSGISHDVALENNLWMLAFAGVAMEGRTIQELQAIVEGMLAARLLKEEESAANKEPNGGSTNHKYGT